MQQAVLCIRGRRTHYLSVFCNCWISHITDVHNVCCLRVESSMTCNPFAPLESSCRSHVTPVCELLFLDSTLQLHRLLNVRQCFFFVRFNLASEVAVPLRAPCRSARRDWKNPCRSFNARPSSDEVCHIVHCTAASSSFIVIHYFGRRW